MKRLIPVFLFSFLLFALFSCNRKSQGGTEDGKKLNENCYIKHNPGPCRMAIKRYYYDEKEKKCKEFIYGGCKGAVPFESLTACQKGCGCK